MAENQLVAEAEALPDLNEYDGMSIADIALAVVHWPEGSEDQQRAIAAIQARAPGIGHNRPPLVERLTEEITPLKARVEEILERARTVVIIDDESCAKVVDLMQLMEALSLEISKAAKAAQDPYLAACAMIGGHYLPLKEPLDVARGERKARTGLYGMVMAYNAKRDAEIAAAQARATEEQRQREEAAAEARRIAETKRAADEGTVGADLAAAAAEDAAETARVRAEAIRPTPVRAQLGQVNSRREITFKITNLRILLGWMIKQPLKNGVEQAARTIMGGYLRQLGVDAVEKGIEIPGLEASITREAAIRR